MDREREIARFFDCCETPSQRKMNTRLSNHARHQLIKGLKERGIDGKTVLEIGSGPGDLTRKLVNLGAAHAVGIDLAKETVEAARGRAAEEGLADRIEYRVGNGAKESLGKYDVVVLDKVICCYPDWIELVDNSSSSAQGLYGFVIPRSDGFGSLLVRFFIAVQGLILKIRKCGFRPYVHDYSKIHSRLESRGFTRTHVDRRLIWMTAVYARS